MINSQCDTFYKTEKVEKGVAFPTCLSINECQCECCECCVLSAPGVYDT